MNSNLHYIILDSVDSSKAAKLCIKHLSYYDYLQTTILPVMKAHGVGLRLPNEPLCMEDLRDCTIKWQLVMKFNVIRIQNKEQIN